MRCTAGCRYTRTHHHCDEFKMQDSNQDTPLHLYLASFYMSILVVMGQNITIYNDTEYVFCIFVMVSGAVLMAFVFGNVERGVGLDP